MLVTQIYISKLVIIGSGDGLAPVWGLANADSM